MAEQTNLKISFCTVCMNRSHHLKQTILKNINDNIDYENLEFVLLDYNSQDDMEQWVKENLSHYIHSGKVVYYKTFEPMAFKHGHAKNLVFKLANNEIICSINADHYTGENFAHYINESFTDNPNIVLTPIPARFYRQDKDHPPGDVWGLVCVKKNDFLSTRGFDERMINYGNEDIDFIHRLVMLNLERVPVEKGFLSGFIEHSDAERISSSGNTDKLHAIYVNYTSSGSSECIFLYKNKTFEKITITDNTLDGSEDYRLSFTGRPMPSFYSFENVEHRGQWEEDRDSVSFVHNKDLQFQLLKDKGNLRSVDGKALYHHLEEPENVAHAFNFYYYGYNTSILQQNLYYKTIAVNPNGFGNAVVFKNFDYNNPIYI